MYTEAFSLNFLRLPVFLGYKYVKTTRAVANLPGGDHVYRAELKAQKAPVDLERLCMDSELI